jgi:integrase/recombinase XerD
LARRREHPDRTRALTRAQLEALWRRSDLRLRDKTLWRLLYDTAARASEALNLAPGVIASDERGWRRAVLALPAPA